MTDREIYASDIPPTVAIILGLKDYLGENLVPLGTGFLFGMLATVGLASIWAMFL